MSTSSTSLLRRRNDTTTNYGSLVDEEASNIQADLQSEKRKKGNVKRRSMSKSSVALIYFLLNHTAHHMRKSPWLHVFNIFTLIVIVVISALLISMLRDVNILFLLWSQKVVVAGQPVDAVVFSSNLDRYQSLKYDVVKQVAQNVSDVLDIFPRINIQVSKVLLPTADCCASRERMYHDLNTYNSSDIRANWLVAIDTTLDRIVQDDAVEALDAEGAIALPQELLPDDDSIAINSTLILRFNVTNFLMYPLRSAGIVYDSDVYAPTLHSGIALPVRVAAILKGQSHFKTPTLGVALPGSDGTALYISLRRLYPLISKYLPPGPLYQRNKAAGEPLAKQPFDGHAHQVLVSLKQRLQFYTQANVDSIQKLIMDELSKFFMLIGFDQVQSNFPVLQYSKSITQFLSLFLTLIINVIIILSCASSCILIYSLLMSDVEGRTHEIGLLRMLGLNKPGIAGLVLSQAVLYSIPASLIGIIVSQSLYYVVYQVILNFGGRLFGDQSVQLSSPFLTWTAFVAGVVLSMLIPTISAIHPIHVSLSNSLRDALDTQRSGSKGVKYSIERASESGPSPAFLTVGITLVGIGGLIYYYFPLSLLSMSITLMLYVFMGVLLMMMLGLVMLSANFQTPIEWLLTNLLFFWENSAIRTLVLKNLISHRQRNQKASIMYTLTLAFIIFSAVGFQINIDSFRYRFLRQYGSRFNLNFPSYRYQVDSMTRMNKFKYELDQFCKTNNKVIAGCGYVSMSLDEIAQAAANLPGTKTNSNPFLPSFKKQTSNSPLKTSIQNLGAYHKSSVQVRGISPHLLGRVAKDFLIVKGRIDTVNSTIDEALYTAEGTSRALIGTLFRENLGLWNTEEDPFVLRYSLQTDKFPRLSSALLKPLAFVSSAAYLHFSEFPMQQAMQPPGGYADQQLVVSLPTFARLSQKIVSGVAACPIKTMLIDIDPKASEQDVKAMKNSMQRLANTYAANLLDVEDELEPVKLPAQLMNYFFMLITFSSMCLCFFSLASSMYGNVQEQAKEIGILRSIGIDKSRTIRLYIYEALLVILTAALLGTMIGCVMCYTMAAQRTLFTQLPIPVAFPWQVFLLVCVLALATSVLSSFTPIVRLLRKPIVTILKKV